MYLHFTNMSYSCSDKYGRGKVLHSTLREKDIKDKLTVPHKINKYTFAKYVIKTLVEFMSSDDRKLIDRHLPKLDPDDRYIPLDKVSILIDIMWCFLNRGNC